VLEIHDHTVTLSAPDTSWTTDDLERYDTVIVGVAPVTSVTASNAYGGLHAIDILWGSDKLVLMVDAPRPLQISASLRSIIGTPSNLVKPFYSKRRGYAFAAEPENSARLLETVRRLLEEDWPTTIYPSLPWQNDDAVKAQFLSNAVGSLTGVNFDIFLVAENPPREGVRAGGWIADDPSSTWTQKIIPTIASNVSSMKGHRTHSDADVDERIGAAGGSLITTHRESTWWTYRIIQSLNNGTPVATDWRETRALGSSWEMLPSAIESLRQSEITELAWSQLEDYIKHIPSRKDADKSLQLIIGKTHAKRKVKK